MDGPKQVLLVTSQDRPLCWVPEPQVTEHWVHSAHGDHPSSPSSAAWESQGLSGLCPGLPGGGPAREEREKLRAGEGRCPEYTLPRAGRPVGTHQSPDVHTLVGAQGLPARAGQRGMWGCPQSALEATGSIVH